MVSYDRSRCMNRPMPDMAFYIMSSLMRCRDMIRPRDRILEEVKIAPGNQVLDFGCGHGSYTFIAAESVGDEGKVYAQDVVRLALDMIEKKASKLNLDNITTICSGCSTEIPDESIDAILFYDVFHLLGNPEAVLEELQRVLRPDGVMSFSDHHMNGRDILSGVTEGGMFSPSEKGKHTYIFRKR